MFGAKGERVNRERNIELQLKKIKIKTLNHFIRYVLIKFVQGLEHCSEVEFWIIAQMQKWQIKNLNT